MLRSVFHALCGTVLLLAASLTFTAPSAAAASLVEVTDFGPNPSNLQMHVYAPDSVADSPAVVVALHYCTGSGPVLHQDTEFRALADRYGFIVVYPSATRAGHCFDASSPEALRRGGGSDPVGIRSMVAFAQREYDGDPKRVFAVGVSSGAMMTNVLLANYPDVFAAGAAFMGVPYGCFASPWGWNVECAGGRIVKTPEQWGDLVRASYPGYRGRLPRIQLWHGTEDGALAYANLGEQVKQWTNVHGVGQNPVSTDNPQPTWTRTRYGNAGARAKVEAVSVAGVGHGLPTPGMAQHAVEFFGLTTPCQVAYQTNSWNSGFTARIRVTNTGDSPVEGWRLAFTLPPGQSITSGWGAAYNGASGQISAENLRYNATIAPGHSAYLGLVATHTGDSGEPNAFTVNGTACEIQPR
ncbi:esterase, PHB depolymerase family [Sinosporangium album]|uniref:Esterase, PHB depolymerase family n=1 Tax=Sinosporangium album TaxID=504805 RepID=A0A1G7VUH8_9ACTN|nr:PHB depolymerase family esterase [Sinosporangium album]SDG63433.1 esterase, PHB depolymerase family [Sinosporangium album]